MSRNFLATIALAALVSIIAGSGAGYFAAKHVSSPTNGSNANNMTEETVRSAILTNPEIIEEAFYALQSKRKAEADAAASIALAQSQDALYNVKLDPTLGVNEAPFVVVEFFDYNCGYCKVASEWMKKALAENPGKMKVIMKDFPVLEGRSEGSRESSEAAWAARLQGQDKYEAFHFALMDTRGGFDSARIDDIADSAGLDVARMRADMKANAPAFEALIQSNFALARQLGIDGTPAFITGSNLISGADTNRLQSLLETAIFEAG